MKNSLLRKPLESCGQLSLILLVVMWVSLTKQLPGEVYCQWYLQFTTRWAWWLHLFFRVRSLFRNCADRSWVGTTKSPMRLCWGGSNGCRAYHIWTSLPFPGAISQRVLVIWLQWSFISLQMLASLVMVAFHSWDLRIKWVKFIVPLLLASREWLHWSRWPSRGWSWQLLWLLSKLFFSFRLSLISHWRIPTSGLTAHQFLATSGMRRLDKTPLLLTELLWLENTLLCLSGIMSPLIRIRLLKRPVA